MNYPLIALHGFLGRPSDWDVLQWESLAAIDLFSFKRWHSLEEWAEQLNNSITQQYPKPILMGYSLGGRLALHSLIHQPERWQGAIIISAHPGLFCSEARKKRLEEDTKWAERFEKEEWQSLMQAWNSRAVFSKDSFAFERKEHDFQRPILAQVLRLSSLGMQKDLRPAIQQLSIPILWITGEKDALYRDLMYSVFLSHPCSKQVVIPNAGHRVPWEQPIAFKHLVMDWLKTKKELFNNIN